MKKIVGGVKGFFGEFKKFITRGNVLDMSVGVIVGGAFTGVVNGLSNFILKPFINFLLSLCMPGKGLEGAVTILQEGYKEETVIVDGVEKIVKVFDLASSIYIDWGAFISAIINFLLIAFTLFLIVKIINSIAQARDKALAGMELSKKKELLKIRHEMKVSRKEAKVIYQQRIDDAKAKQAEEARIAEEKAKEEARLAEERAMANTRLLEEIRDLLKQK